jgi:hypothetical protein
MSAWSAQSNRRTPLSTFGTLPQSILDVLDRSLPRLGARWPPCRDKEKAWELAQAFVNRNRSRFAGPLKKEGPQTLQEQ